MIESLIFIKQIKTNRSINIPYSKKEEIPWLLTAVPEHLVVANCITEAL